MIKNSDPTPLASRRIVVTRAREQAGPLCDQLERLGAEVIALPLIQITAAADPTVREDVFAEIGSYEWLVFSSANGVRYFFEEFFSKFTDIRSLGGTRIAAVGPATAAAIKQLHLAVDLVPQKHLAEELADALVAEQSLDNVKVLVVTGDRNRDVIMQRLANALAIVDQFPVYKTESTNLNTDTAAENFRQSGADAILFTSSSGVHSFVDQAGVLALAKSARQPIAGSIGPVTSEAMRKVGMPIGFEAHESTIEGLVRALVAKLGRS
jgi:uroporphyrinogen-III synthase